MQHFKRAKGIREGLYCESMSGFHLGGGGGERRGSFPPKVLNFPPKQLELPLHATNVIGCMKAN